MVKWCWRANASLDESAYLLAGKGGYLHVLRWLKKKKVLINDKVGKAFTDTALLWAKACPDAPKRFLSA